MANYYFLAGLLTPLSVDHPPEMKFEEFYELCKENLNPSDFAKFKQLCYLYDLENLHLIWMGKEKEHFGNYQGIDLEEASRWREDWPEPIQEYLNLYDKVPDRLEHFEELQTQFWLQMDKVSSGFLKKYYHFEKRLRIVLAALRAKYFGLDLQQLASSAVGQDDDWIDLVPSKEAKAFIAKEEFEPLNAIFEVHRFKPETLEKEINRWHLSAIEEIVQGDLFGMDRLLAYTAQLVLVERWHQNGLIKGRTRLNEMIQVEG